MMKSIITILAVILISNSSLANVSNGNLPPDLNKIAKQENCKPVNNYYDQEGIVFPPYVYGWSGNIYLSAAFWCEKQKGKYFLIFVERDDIRNNFSLAKSCENKLEFVDYPSGLHIEKMDVNFKEFNRFSDNKKVKSSEVFKNQDVLVSKYEGEGIYLYCKNKKWYFSSFH